MSIEENKKIVEPRSKAGIDPGAASTIRSMLTGAWAARLVHTAAELGITHPLPPRRHIPAGLFTTIATLGTPRDVSLEEIRIEFFFPMDEPTAEAFHRLANR